MPGRRSRSRYSDSSDSDPEYQINIPINMPSHHRRHSRERRETEFLAVPIPVGGRQRAASTGASPQPQIVINAAGSRSSSGSHSRSRSRERHRPRSRSRRRSGSSSTSEEVVRIRRDHHRGRAWSDVDTSPNRSYHDYELQRRLDKLKDFERHKRDEDIKKEVKKEIELEILKEEQEREEKKAEKKRLLEEAKKEEMAKKEKERQKKEKEDKEFNERVKKTFMAAGYSESHIESILKEKEKKRNSNSRAVDLARPTFIKVNRKHLHPDTLDAYNLPWDFYDRDPDYLIIKQYISSSLQEELFEHTRLLKRRSGGKLILEVEDAPEEKVIKKDTITTLKVEGRGSGDKDKMYLVRNKSQTRGKSRERVGSKEKDVRRRSWIFT